MSLYLDPQFQKKFEISTKFTPAGDQPTAIKSLVDGVNKGLQHQTLFGVTGSGKTYTSASVIAQVQKPTLVIAHNKTLAAQLAQEYREFFPNNAVHYFVSYYDYYQPEAYMPVSDTYIEKEAQINEEIDRLRHASTQALLTRKDVIIVASVSCIYGLGSPVEYEKVHLRIETGSKNDRAELIRKLINIYFERTTADLKPGAFRAMGNMIEIMPVNERIIYRIELKNTIPTNAKPGSKEAVPNMVVHQILKIDATTRAIIEETPVFFLFPAKHFVTPADERKRAITEIKHDLDIQLKQFQKEGRILEADRLKRRTTYDLALIKEVGYCNGIENYSRHFSGKAPGEAPDTLLSYFPHKKDGSADFLTIIDESHVTIPQLHGMYAGDQSRKETLVNFGFRLPSAKDNRPLKFEEFTERVGQLIYTSATPGKYEMENSKNIAEQVIRPTGLVDPIIEVRPVTAKLDGSYQGQVFDFIEEAQKTIKKGFRVIATTLTKKMAEDLSEYLIEKKIKTKYLHSDILTLERIQILTELRRGTFDVLIGVNLLREGLDLPEIAFIGILDADKEGFLRSESSLIQTIGRAARNTEGKVVLYADKITGSMERAMGETNRRREKQFAYNTKHGITPQTIIKKINDITDQIQSDHAKTVSALMAFDLKRLQEDPEALMKDKENQMNDAVKMLDFETAAILRDEIQMLAEKAGITTFAAHGIKRKNKDKVKKKKFVEELDGKEGK